MFLTSVNGVYLTTDVYYYGDEKIVSLHKKPPWGKCFIVEPFCGGMFR